MSTETSGGRVHVTFDDGQRVTAEIAPPVPDDELALGMVSVTGPAGSISGSTAFGEPWSIRTDLADVAVVEREEGGFSHELSRLERGVSHLHDVWDAAYGTAREGDEG